MLAIRLDNPPESSRWYPGGGIYRHVWLEKTAPIHVAHWGSYVTTPAGRRRPRGGHGGDHGRQPLGRRRGSPVRTDLFECGADGHPAGNPVASARQPKSNVKAGGSQIAYARRRWTTRNSGTCSIPTSTWRSRPSSRNTGPWTVARPSFGIRTILFTPDNGFLLNGKRVPIQGVCDHHDLGALGAALNDRALQRQLEILQSMGCNAIRTSHNPPAPELLALCDRMGILIMDESFDCWDIPKKPNGYSLLFDDWHDRDQRALVRRDRNHPSVILWSIGNEIPEQPFPEGPAMAAELVRGRPHGGLHPPDDRRLQRDQQGATTASRRPSTCSATTTNRRNTASSARPTRPSRFSAAKRRPPSVRADFSFSRSAPGKERRGWRTSRSATTVCTRRVGPLRRMPSSKGRMNFPTPPGSSCGRGFDYLGEPSPYNDQDEVQELKEFARSSYFGIVDLAGIPKERFYLYQSRWRSDLPMAHLLPHWTWPDRVGQVTPVHVFTSGDEAELFLNGQSLGRKKRNRFQYRLRWDDVRYAPGELKVVAYKDGKEWATDVERTAGPAAKIALKATAAKLAADGKDLSFVTVMITDADGVLDPRAVNPVHFTVSGPADIVANGQRRRTSFEPLTGPDHRAFYGKCMAIVRTRPGAAGAITLRAESAGLQAASVELRSH